MTLVSDLADQMALQVTNAKKNTGNAGGLSNSGKTLAENYQTFLTLLTTQLKHQDPTAPLDTNQFMQQLTQFSSVEQQLKSNDLLGSIKSGQNSSVTSGIVGYLQKYVTAKGTQSTTEADGTVAWQLNSPSTAAGAKITIRDSKGAIVATETRDIAQGKTDYVWNGRTTTGGQAPAGSYSISIDAKDTYNSAVNVDTNVSGIVTEVDLSGAEPMLTVNGLKVKASGVTEIRLAG